MSTGRMLEATEKRTKSAGRARIPARASLEVLTPEPLPRPPFTPLDSSSSLRSSSSFDSTTHNLGHDSSSSSIGDKEECDQWITTGTAVDALQARILADLSQWVHEIQDRTDEDGNSLVQIPADFNDLVDTLEYEVEERAGTFLTDGQRPLPNAAMRDPQMMKELMKIRKLDMLLAKKSRANRSPTPDPMTTRRRRGQRRPSARMKVQYADLYALSSYRGLRDDEESRIERILGGLSNGLVVYHPGEGYTPSKDEWERILEIDTCLQDFVPEAEWGSKSISARSTVPTWTSDANTSDLYTVRGKRDYLREDRELREERARLRDVNARIRSVYETPRQVAHEDVNRLCCALRVYS